MSNDTTKFTRVNTIGLVVVVLSGVLVLYLKSIGIREFGPVPTLALPLALFVIRAWWSAKIAPEKIKKHQRMAAAGITMVCVLVLVSVMLPA
ncbi:MAG: hypothetical protein R3E66_03240 [bacterium]